LIVTFTLFNVVSLPAHAFLLGFINTRVLVYARHLALILPLVGEFSLNRGGLLNDLSRAAIASWISS